MTAGLDDTGPGERDAQRASAGGGGRHGDGAVGPGRREREITISRGALVPFHERDHHQLGSGSRSPGRSGRERSGKVERAGGLRPARRAGLPMPSPPLTKPPPSKPPMLPM